MVKTRTLPNIPVTHYSTRNLRVDLLNHLRAQAVLQNWTLEEALNETIVRGLSQLRAERRNEGEPVKKLLVDEKRGTRYVRAWKERRETAVQIWNSGEPKGEPDGDWVMPSVLPAVLAIEQALLQTPE